MNFEAIIGYGQKINYSGIGNKNGEMPKAIKTHLK